MKERAWLRAALRGLAVLVMGLSLWSPLEAPLCAGYSAVANGLLAPLDFATIAGEASARLQSAQHAARDDPSWDTLLVLQVAGIGKVDEVFVNLRRSLYLPALLLIALIAAAPLGLRARLRCLAFGVPAIVLYALGSVWATSHWLFARMAGVVESWSPLHRLSTELLYRAVVVPESNRYIVPLLMAAALWIAHRAPPMPCGSVKGER